MSEPIRVLHVVTHMNRGGLETMIMNYYRHIDRNKIQFDFLTHREGKKDYDDEIQSLGGKIYHLPPLNPFDRHGYLKKLDEFFQEHQEYKIVHSHLDCMSAYPLRAAKKYGVPVRIAHSHNTSQERNLKYLVKLYSRSLIPKYATDLFACSKEAGEWMFKDEKFIIMKNAIDCEKYLYDVEERRRVREELGVENKFVVGHVGRFNIQKNHRFLIDIFYQIHKRNSNAILMLVGEGELKEEIEKNFKDKGLEDSVKFLGVRNDVERVMQAMDSFVFPSLFEGLGIVVIEAQMAGIPCIVSDAIPQEAKISENIKFMSIKSSASDWAETALKFSKMKTVRKDLVDDSGYDIKTNTRWLTEKYQDSLGGSK